MKFSTSRSEFARALALVAKSIPTRATGHPILNHVKLCARGKSVVLTGYDLATGVQIPCAAEIEAEGEFTLPATQLKGLVDNLPECSLSFELDKEQMILTVPQGKFRIPGLPTEEYPLLPSVDGEGIEMQREVLVEGIKLVAGIASTDQTKQVLTGVHISAKSGAIEFAATDGHRLGVVKYAVEGDNTFSLTLPSQSLRLISELFDTDTLQISWDGLNCLFSDGDRVLVCRILDGQYPHYRQLIPHQFSHRLMANRKEMISAINLVRIFALNGVVRMRPGIDSLALTADALDAGGGSRTILVECPTESPEVAFKATYVIKPLESFPTLEIEVAWNTPTSPMVMRPVGLSSGEEVLYLLMPVQIRH